MESQAVKMVEVCGRQVQIRAMTFDDSDLIPKVVSTFTEAYFGGPDGELKPSAYVRAGVAAAKVALEPCMTPKLSELGPVPLYEAPKLIQAWLDVNKWEELVPHFLALFQQVKTGLEKIQSSQTPRAETSEEREKAAS